MRRLPRRVVLAIATLATTGLLATGCAASGSGAGASTANQANIGYNTVTDGTITVGIYAGGLPYVSEGNGKCVGIDCTALNMIADELGLKVEVEVMSFPAMLAGVQAHRIDVAMGELSWTPSRAKQGLMTDPIYYSRASVLQPEGSHIDTIDGLKGETVGALVGANWIEAVQAIPGTTVKTYQSADALYSDLTIGRLETGFIDALQDQYVKKLKPQFKFNSVPLRIDAEEVKATPAYVTFQQNQDVLFVSNEEPQLASAMNKKIQKMWQDKSITSIFSNLGISDTAPYLTPTDAVRNRISVDRSTNWTPPSLGYAPAGE